MNDKDLNIIGQVVGNSDEDPQNSGIVYLLKNEAMPGLVKIGKTTRSDPQLRVDELYNSSVPVPFECVLAMRVDDPSSVEFALHTAFGPQRVNLNANSLKSTPSRLSRSCVLWDQRMLHPLSTKRTTPSQTSNARLRKYCGGVDRI